MTTKPTQDLIADAVNAVLSADKRIAKAWVSFDGTNGTILDSHNIDSVVRSGTGDYDVTFTNDMADANYAVLLSVKANASNRNCFANLGGTSDPDPSVSGFNIRTLGSTNVSATDAKFVYAVIYGA